MQIELSPETEKLLKELVAHRKRELPDYETSLTALGNTMIKISVYRAFGKRKPKNK